LSLDKKAEEALSRLADRAKALSGTYFRSVEYRDMDPTSVLSGRGTELYGGRFASIGTRAVYVSDSDRTASEEVTARKERLGGKAQISLEKYPRIVFAVNVQLERHISFLKKPRDRILEALWKSSLDEDNLGASQVVGAFFHRLGIQGILFPSVVIQGTNLIAFVANCAGGSLQIVNLDELTRKIKEITRVLPK